jgi:hypothetical protein
MIRRRIITISLTVVAALAILFIAGCTGTARDVSTPQKALLGHWQIKDSQTKIDNWDDIYFSGTTAYFSEGTGETSKGNKYQDQYTVVSASSKTFSILIEYPFTDLKTGQLMTARQIIKFSSDKKSLTFTQNTDTRKSSEELGPYSYIGPETKP